MNRTGHLTSPPQKLSDRILFLGFLLIPLACTPLLQDNYTIAKWLVIYAITFLLLMGFAIQGRVVRIPRVGVTELFLLAGLAMIYGINLAFRRSTNFEGPLLNQVVFIVLILASVSHFSSTIGLGPVFFATRISALLVSLYGLLQLAGVQLISSLSVTDISYLVSHSSFFGHINMTAQYLGFAVILLGHSLRDSQIGTKTRWTTMGILLIVLFYLVTLSCRSVWVALAIAQLFYEGRGLLKKVRIWAPWGAVLIGALCICYAFSPHFQSILSRLIRSKGLTSSFRVELWQATLAMIRDFPFGIGTDNFEFSILPYKLGRNLELNEGLAIETPHNDFLRVLAEQGVAYFLCLLATLILWLKQLRLRAEQPDGFRDYKLCFALLAYFSIESFFQFPFETPTTFFVMAIFIGWFLANIYSNSQYFRFGWINRVTSLSLAALVAWLGMNYGYSHWVMSRYSLDGVRFKQACRIFPSHWRACIASADQEFMDGNLADAKRDLHAILRQHPNQYFAMRTLGQIYFNENNSKMGCQMFGAYDSLFSGQSSIHQEWLLGGRRK